MPIRCTEANEGREESRLGLDAARTRFQELALKYSLNAAVMGFPCRDSGIYGVAKPYSLA